MRSKNLFCGLLVALLFLGDRSAYADLFVSAASANAVMRFDGTTGALIGNFVAPNAGGLADPQGIAFGPDGHLYVASNGSNNVLQFDGQTGQFLSIFATVSGMSFPAEINFRNGHLYVSEFSPSFLNGRVSRFDATTGAFVDHFVASASRADGQEWDGNGDLYVSNFGTNSIRKYNGTTGALIGDFVSPSSGGLSGPLDNLFIPNGNLLVSSFGNGRIKQYDPNGNYINDPITGLTGGPQGLEIGPDGMLYAGDFGRGLINRYDIDTFAFLGTFATTGGTSTTNNFTFRPNTIPEANPVLLLAITFIGVWVVGVGRTRRQARKSMGHPRRAK